MKNTKLLIETINRCGQVDFAVTQQGFLLHGRDYAIDIANCITGLPGRLQLVFTHCVRLDYETRVPDSAWPISWTEEFTDYEKWKSAGEPAGYVWGTNWSNAYPGLTVVENSAVANEWTTRIGREFFEITLETERFFLRIIFHDLNINELTA